MKAIITIGIAASGKSTWAKEQKGYFIICRDDIRADILWVDGFDVEKNNIWSKWNFKREKEVTDLYWLTVEGAASREENIILADTNLNLQRRQDMQKRLEVLGYEVELHQFDVTFEEAVKRDRMRKDVCGVQVIWKQYLELYGETYSPNPNLPKCILVDVDGTLAHTDGKRGPFDWAKVGEDRCDEVVKQIVNNFARNHDVIVLSGRDGVCKNQTAYWLGYNGVSFDELYMRAEGDCRKDFVVKRELFDAYIRDKYNVVCVIDDRPVVCREWLRMGLKVMAVGDPWTEF